MSVFRRIVTMRLLLLSCLLVVCPARAYDVETHADISLRAVQGSNLQQSLPAIGLDSSTQVLSDGLLSFPTKLSIVDWIRVGSIREDDFFSEQLLRFLNHFYNPLDGSGLSINGLSGLPSKYWGLEPVDIGGQNYSFKDARTYLFKGLTYPNQADREANLALTFRTLGDVLHLIQDLAQPQHTRNDSHGVYSYYEKFTNRLGTRRALPFGGYASIYPGPDPSVFNDPGNIWHAGANSVSSVLTGKGLADYSNRGFVTADTNFIGSAARIRPDPRFPYPTGADAEIEKKQITDPSLLGPTSPTQGLIGEIWFIRTAVTDTYTGEPPRVIRSSTFSIFSSDLEHYVGGDWAFNLNRFNFNEFHTLLIPRAVGYSAGLINYFFRGQIDVQLPKDGVYAIVDHTAQSANTGGCDTPCGFRKVKLQLKNSSPAGEDMGAGTLLLVAKYHLNTCYRSDLSGEFGAPNYAGPACRSAAESIVVSDANPISSLGRDFVESTFVFTAPIPINATDLYLQVVFQGKLGVEEGALAVATVDVREPTFLIFSNDTDFQAVYNMDGTFARTVPYLDAGASSLNLELRFKQDAQNPTAVTNELDPGFYHRIAVLTDQDYVDYFLAERFFSQPNFFTREWVPPATVNQTFSTGQVIHFPEYVTLRHTTATEWAYTANAPGAPIYWEPGWICTDGSINCVPEDRTVDAVVRRYPPFKQPDPVPMTINF